MDEDAAEAAQDHPSARPGSRDGSRDGTRDGDHNDRGRRRAIGLDLGELSSQEDFRPVVEYLTAIQTMRGDGGSLLFVRDDDLDAMAERDGRPVPEFLDRLDQLGVVVSSN